MINTDRAELIASLRELRLELSDKVADMLEADAQELTRLRDLARDAANAATQLQKQVLLLSAQQVAAPVAWMKFARKKPAVTSLSFSSELSTLEKAHGFVSTPLCHCAPPAEAQQLPVWEAERIDDYEIRVTSPEGESWRLRSADRNDSFNNFIWRWAESMVSKGAV